MNSFVTKIAGIGLSLSLLISGVIVPNVGAESSNITQEQKENNFTMLEIQNMLFNYFKENNVNYELGSNEYINYLNSIILFDEDEKLAKHPNYKDIIFYASEYLYRVDQQKGEDNVDFLKDDNLFDFSFVENKTMTELREEAELEEEKVEQETIDFKLKNGPSISTYAYVPSKTVNYANSHYKTEKYNKDYNNWDKRGGDCTNFASQAVLAGGVAKKFPKIINAGVSGNTNYWYSMKSSNSSWRESSSWIRVEDFHTFWKKYHGVTTSTSKVTIHSNARPGDVVQNKRGNRYTHSMVVTAKPGGSLTVVMHSPNTEKNFMNGTEVGNGVAPADQYRVIKFR